MSFPRGLAWLLALFIVVPAVTAGVDWMDRRGEALVFTPPPLAAGDAYTFDARVVSSFLDLDQTATGHAHLDIGAPHHGPWAGSDATGPADAGVAVQTVRHRAPWDAHVTPPVDDLERLRTDQQWTKTEYVSLAEGRVLHRALSFTEHDWYDMGPDTMRLDRNAYRGIHRPETVDWPLDALIRHLQTDYGYVDPLVADLDTDPLPKAERVTTARAELDGTTVYGYTSSHTHKVSDAAPFACDLELPYIEYREPVTAEKHAQVGVWSTVRQTVWLDPTLPVPVYAVCTADYRKGDATGKPLGTIRLEARLTEVERGTDLLDLAWTLPTGGDHERLATRAVNAYGVVDDNGAGFAYPLADALVDLETSTDPQVKALFEASATKPLLLWAAYHPDAALTLCHRQAPLAPQLVPNPCARDIAGTLDRATLDPYWDLYLADDDGQWLNVHAHASFADAQHAAERADAYVMIADQGDLGPKLIARHALPPAQVPIDALFHAWLDHQGLSVQSWRASPGASFVYALEHRDGGYLPHATFRIDAEPTEVTEVPPPPRRTGDGLLGLLGDDTEDGPGGGKFDAFADGETEFHRYRATDGALVESGHDETGAYAVDPPEPAPAAAETLDVRLVAAPHAMMLALVAGLGSLVALWGAAKTDAGRRFVAIAFTPLFTKLTRDQVIEHKTRDEMIAYVAENPGVGTEEIRKHLDIGWGTAVYHLSALEQNHVLSSLKTGGHRHWFPARSMDPRTKAAIAVLHSHAARRIYEAIRSRPGATQQEIAQDLGVTHGAVIFQVRKLAQAGLVEKERAGRFVRYHPLEVPGAVRDPVGS